MTDVNWELIERLKNLQDGDKSTAETKSECEIYLLDSQTTVCIEYFYSLPLTVTVDGEEIYTTFWQRRSFKKIVKKIYFEKMERNKLKQKNIIERVLGF